MEVKMKFSEQIDRTPQQVDWIERKVTKAMKEAKIDFSIAEWTEVDSSLASEIIVDSEYPMTIAALQASGWIRVAQAGLSTVMGRFGSEVYVSEDGTRIKIPEHAGDWNWLVIEANIKASMDDGASISTSKEEFKTLIVLATKLALALAIVKWIVTPKIKKVMGDIAKNLSAARRQCKYIEDESEKGLCKLKVKLLEAESELELLTMIYNDQKKKLTDKASKEKIAKLDRAYKVKSKKLMSKIKQINTGLNSLEKQIKRKKAE